MISLHWIEYHTELVFLISLKIVSFQIILFVPTDDFADHFELCKQSKRSTDQIILALGCDGSVGGFSTTMDNTVFI